MESSKLILSLFLICFIYFPQHALSCGSCRSPGKGGDPSIKPPVHVPTIPKLPAPPVTVPKLPVPPVTVPNVPVPPVTVPHLPLPPVSGPPLPPVSGLPIPPVSGLPMPNLTLPPVPGVPLPPVSGLPMPNLPLPPVPGIPLPPVSGLPMPNLPLPPVPGVPLPPVSGLPMPNLPLPPVSGVPLPPISRLPIPNLPLPPLPIVGPVLPPGTKPPATGGKDCPPPPKSGKATCPINILKLGACVNLLGGLVKINLGDPAVNKCCPLLKGLAEVEAAACLCTTLKVKALDLKLYVPVALQLLITCGKNPPPGYTCSL